MKLKIIIGSTRPGRVGKAIGDWFTAEAQKHGKFEIEVLDLAEINLPFLDEPAHPRFKTYTKPHTFAWSAKIEDGDAYIFVIPEYNYSLTAPVKNAIDFLSQEWKYKPVSFVSYGGRMAGTRALQMLKQVVTTLDMMPIFESVNVSMTDTPVKDDLSDPANPKKVFAGNEHLAKSAVEMLDKMVIWTKHLNNMRAEMNTPK